MDVPERAKGRKSDHTERYSFARLLPHMKSELDFPLMAIHTDKPDFILVSPRQRIGIELVEAVPENVAEANFLRGKGHGPETWFLQRAIVGERRKSSKRILKEIAADDPGAAWIGDASERDTTEAIVHFASQKVGTCTKPGFGRYDKNILAIYNNWPGPALHFRKSISIAHPYLISAGVFDCFDMVAVIDSTEIAIIGQDGFTIKTWESNR